MVVLLHLVCTMGQHAVFLFEKAPNLWGPDYQGHANAMLGVTY